MGEGVTWTEVAQVLTAIASLFIAVIAVALAIRSDKRSREAMRVQTYLELRSGFLDIFRDLGQLDQEGTDTVELRLVREAYWHHAWDEWYITHALAPREFAALWDDFFADAVRSGYRHPGLKESLERLTATNDAFATYAKEMIDELQRSERPERK